MPLSANLFRLEFSIRKHAGSKDAAPAGGAGGHAQNKSCKKKKLFNFFLLKCKIFHFLKSSKTYPKNFSLKSYEFFFTIFFFFFF